VPVVMHDNPAWVLQSGIWLRVLSADPEAVAIVSSDRWHACGAAAEPPQEFALPELPASVPDRLAGTLTAVGPVLRFATFDLWEALATAIIRQVIRADHARLLHHKLRAAHGRLVQTPHGPGHMMPDAATVAELPVEAFTALGMRFKCRSLKTAAAAYLDQGSKWRKLPPARLVQELQTVPRIGPWTAGAAVADYSHDWTLYPYGDLAVRKWAALAAADVNWPDTETAFAARWRQIAGDHLGPLTFFTLAWGASCATSA
jgi:DNA-3-methyladenine glycosylase II